MNKWVTIAILLLAFDGNAQENNNEKKNTQYSISESRKLVKAPNTTGIKSEEACKIVLYLLVDEEGNIYGSPEIIRNETTTKNQALLDAIISAVKDGVKYNSKPNSGIEKVRLVLRISA